MSFSIIAMSDKDRSEVLDMMRVFYASPAVLSDGSEEIFAADFEHCVGDSPYAEGYVFTDGGEYLGYAMLSKSYSTEFGKPCIWIEDLYVKPSARRRGIGGCFLRFVQQKYPNAVLRLEVEPENQAAVALYRKCGFDVLPYTEMKK